MAGSGFWGFGSSRIKFRFMRFGVSVTIGFVVGVLVVGGVFGCWWFESCGRP